MGDNSTKEDGHADSKAVIAFRKKIARLPQETQDYLKQFFALYICACKNVEDQPDACRELHFLIVQLLQKQDPTFVACVIAEEKNDQ